MEVEWKTVGSKVKEEVADEKESKRQVETQGNIRIQTRIRK